MSPEKANARVNTVSKLGLFNCTCAPEEATSISISAEGFVGKIERLGKSDSLGIVLRKSVSQNGLIIATIKNDSKFRETELKEGMKIIAINGSPCPADAKEAIRVMQNTVGQLKVVAIHSNRDIESTLAGHSSSTDLVEERPENAKKADACSTNLPPEKSTNNSTLAKEEQRSAKKAEYRKLLEKKKEQNQKKEQNEKKKTDSPNIASNNQGNEVVPPGSDDEPMIIKKVTSPRQQKEAKGAELMKRLDRLEFSLGALESSVKGSRGVTPSSKTSVVVTTKPEEDGTENQGQSGGDNEPCPSNPQLIEVDREPTDKEPAKIPFSLFKVPRRPIGGEQSVDHRISDSIDLDKCQNSSILPSLSTEINADKVAPAFSGQLGRLDNKGPTSLAAIDFGHGCSQGSRRESIEHEESLEVARTSDTVPGVSIIIERGTPKQLGSDGVESRIESTNKKTESIGENLNESIEVTQVQEQTEENNSRRGNANSSRKSILSDIKLFTRKSPFKTKWATKRQQPVVDPEPQHAWPILLEIDVERAQAEKATATQETKSADELEVKADITKAGSEGPLGLVIESVADGLESLNSEITQPNKDDFLEFQVGNAALGSDPVKAHITKMGKHDRLGFKVVKFKDRDGIFVSQIDEFSELVNSDLRIGMRITKINGMTCPDNIPDTVYLVKTITGILELEAVDGGPNGLVDKTKSPSVLSMIEGKVASILDSVFVNPY
eukprot:scaffold981_cov119-Cylindrotheca_fusiformis.AAC.5